MITNVVHVYRVCPRKTEDRTPVATYRHRIKSGQIAGVSAEMALRLSQALGTSAEMWVSILQLPETLTAQNPFNLPLSG